MLGRRSLDPVRLLNLGGLLFGRSALLVGSGVKLVLVRESRFCGMLGVVCLVSLLLRSWCRVMFYVGHFFAAGSDPPKRAAFDRLWQYERVRRV